MSLNRWLSVDTSAITTNMNMGLAKYLVTIFLVVTTSSTDAANGTKWSYDGAEDSLPPPLWKNAYPSCGGESQSPVALRLKDSLPLVRREPFLGYVINPLFEVRNVVLENNGHSVAVNLQPRKHRLLGGMLGAAYYAANVHFSWGSDDNKGSEHTLGGRRYPLEMHVVHHNVKYSDVREATEASNDTTALAVLGFMFQIVDQDNKALEQVVSGVKKLSGKPLEGSSVQTTLTSVPLGPLIRDAVHLGFYRYNGSLTTPGCNEQVLWTVFNRPLKISARQVHPFRSLLNNFGAAMLFNYRPLQSVGSRKIFHVL